MATNTSTTSEVVVITGASAGVGRAIVRAFAQRGASIGLLARGEAGLEGAKHDVEELGGRAIAIPTDVADPQQVEAAAEKVEQTFGHIDIWVNVAMASVFAPFKEMDAQDFKRVTEVTYLGQVYGTMSALKRMLPRDKGRIILIGSALAYVGIPLQSAYCGGKHGIKGFFQSLRTELMHDKSNVKISMIQLPAVNTPQFSWVKSKLPNKAQPVPPIYEPEIIAGAVTYVADHYRREMYLGFSTIKAIWGNRVAPWYVDSYLARTGYKSQQTNQKADPNRPNNLYHPADDKEDHGAHGSFDNRSITFSPQVWADKRIGLLAIAGAALMSLLLLAVGKRATNH
ncbi:MAG TPA: short-chain dehydrogenase [Ktedonobacter sp.]|nr:short-chain dehydrogenase [Ktedonobacter sp.]